MIEGVSVAAPGDKIEADLIAGLLESAGVNAIVVADDAGGLDPALQLSGVHVLVKPEDEAAARAVLAEQAARAEQD